MVPDGSMDIASSPFVPDWSRGYIRGNQGVVIPETGFKSFLCDGGAFRGCLGGVQEVSGGIKEYQGVFRVYFVSETAQLCQKRLKLS